MLRELLTADVQRIESIGAVGTVLEQVFFRFRLLLHGLVLAEAISTPLYPSRLDGQYQVIIILTVEERHKTLLAGEPLTNVPYLVLLELEIRMYDSDYIKTVLLLNLNYLYLKCYQILSILLGILHIYRNHPF